MKRPRGSNSPSLSEDAVDSETATYQEALLLAAYRDKRYQDVARLALDAMICDQLPAESNDPHLARAFSSIQQASDAAYEVVVSWNVGSAQET